MPVQIKNRPLSPVVKWAGGKRQLLEMLLPLLPERMTVYCEPFVGGGAMLFALHPPVARVSDVNEGLIELYEVIRDDVEALLQELRDHRNEASHYYDVRGWDRDEKKFRALSKVQKAARLLYLNKTCYNGLYRVNRSGEFNVPFGRYKNPDIVNESALRAAGEYFRGANVSLSCAGYAETLASLPEGSFVYLDPPYDPVSDTASFMGYTRGGFGRDDQIRLRECCDDLHRRNIKFMLSNSATDFVRAQYAAYSVTIVQAKRAISANAEKRGVVDEVVVRNY